MIIRILVVFMCMICLPRPAASQSCSASPIDKGELWIGGGSWRGGESNITDASLEFSAFGRLFLSAVTGRGGYSVNVAPSSQSVRFGGLFSALGGHGCVYVDRELMTYDFRERHDVDRGDVIDRVRQFGLSFERGLLAFHDLDVRLALGAGLAHRSWEMLGRRLVIDESVEVEEVHRRDRDWRAVAQASLAVRWSRVGVTAGLSRRPTLDDRWIGYVRVGFAAIQLPRSPSP